LSRHLREVCMKNGGSPVPPEATSAVQKPVVSVRLQMKQLLSKKQHDYLDNVGISRSNIGPSSEKYMRRDVKSSIPSLPESPIFPKRSDQGTSADKTAISSIIVARDKSTSDIKRILFKDAHDPRQPEYIQLYPSTRNTRGRIRCVRAILCNQTTISDENEPTDEQLPYDYLLPLLFRNLNFATIIDHAQANYGQVTNEELERLRQEGIKQICGYFGRDEPGASGYAYTTLSAEDNNFELKNSIVRTGTPLSDTHVSDSEKSEISTSAPNSLLLSPYTMESSPPTIRSREWPLEVESPENKKSRTPSKSKPHEVLAVSEVEGITSQSYH